MKRLKFLRQATLPVLAGLVITFSAVTAHNDGVARDRSAKQAIVVSCETTHNGLTKVITAVGVAVTTPANGHTPTAEEIKADEAFVQSLQDAADSEYTDCLLGVTK